MFRTFCRILVVLFLCGGAGCAQAPTGLAADFRTGDWWGGFGLIDGDRLHWTHFIATLRAKGPGITGEGMYITGPDQGRISDKAIDISGAFRGETLRLRLSFDGRKVDCDLDLEAEHAAGACVADGESLTLRMVRVASFDPAEASEIQSVYGFDEGRRILVGQIGPVPMMLDLPSGQMRVLFPKGDGAWTAGPRMLVGHPEEWRLVFEKDELRVERDGEALRRGKRRPEPTTEEFSFTSERDGVTLRGTLTLPQGSGPHPGVVWVHGSGRTPRSEAMFFPRYMADLGFALLAFDKRGVGESGGKYAMPDGSTFNVSFLRRRGADVASAMNALRRHPRIADRPVGLMGISQAGWVLPVAASSTECAFTISMSGGATRLSQEAHFSELTDELRSDAAARSIEDALAKVRARKPRGHDWSSDFASQSCPGLWLYGLNDRINPSQLAVEVLEAVKAEHGKDFTIVTFPEGNHPLMQSRLGGRAESVVLTGFVAGKFPTIEGWLEERGFMP
ncbi:MAG: hypothetical protein MPN21_06865 [Thermoanaerobaculia bacterium]|nr:hypothetical protein [Thermoanaerobaculia bacterium]